MPPAVGEMGGDKSTPQTGKIDTSECCTNCCTNPPPERPKTPWNAPEPPIFNNNIHKAESFRNRQVIGSSPIVGSIFSIAYRPSVHHLLHNCCTLEFFLELFHRIHGVFTGRLDVKALSRADAFMPENGLNGSVGHA